MSAGFRVTVEDLDTGEVGVRTVHEGDFILIPFDPCYLSATSRYANGTVQLTLKGHSPQVEAPQT